MFNRSIAWCICLAICSACNLNPDDPLLEMLPADRTGVSFANTITENDSFNILNYIYIYNGAGVAAGDLNNDDWPDLFFTGNQVSSKLYLNRADFQFQDISVQAGINDNSWSTGVTMVDINQDGWLDIYVCVAHPELGRAAPNLLYINQGTDEQGVPHFVEAARQYGLADEGYSTQAAFFDYDRDGDLDMYLLTNGLEEVRSRYTPRMNGPLTDGSTPNTDRLYRNEGRDDQSGQITFVNASKEAGIQIEGWGLGIAITDINQDGWPDIYVANDFLSSDILYINQGKSGEKVTFDNQIDRYFNLQSRNGMGVDVADFNNDALPDVVELDMQPDDNARKKSMFSSINHNLWHMNRALGYTPQYVRNTLQLNNGNGSFSEIGQLAGIHQTDWSWTPLLLDLDNDGFRDLLITNGYHRDVTDLDYINYRKQTDKFGTRKEKDRKLLEELNQLNGVKKHNYLFRNKGDLTFEDQSENWGFTAPSYSNGAAFADFDRDGDLDLAINNINDPAFIYRNQILRETDASADNPNYLRINLEGLPPNRNGIGTKIRIIYRDKEGGHQQQFHEQNLSRGYKSSVEPIIHFGLAKTASVDTLLVTWPDQKEQILQNVRANQEITLYQRDAAVKTNDKLATGHNFLFSETSSATGLTFSHQEYDHIDFDISPLKPVRHSQSGPGIAVGDVDGNGLDDMYIGGSHNYPGTWFRQLSPGKFQQDTMKIDQSYEDLGALLFDADQDSDLDLYVVSGGSEQPADDPYYQDRLYRNDGNGHFERDVSALPEIRASGSCVTACDFDHDGDLDLFVGGRVLPYQYPLPPVSYLLENDKGQFKDVTDTHAPELRRPGMVTSALWTDVDRDGWRDLLLVGEWMPITLFSNKQGQLVPTEVPAFQSSFGWWNSLAAADFDRDGDVDYIAGNLGYNSLLHASEDQPVCIYAKDFDENGSIDPVMCYYIDGYNRPYHPRDQLIKQIVPIRRRFPLYADYGRASIKNMFLPQELKGAYIVKSTQFASMYIENQGAGQFALHELPLEAQFAPIFGLQALDYNHDGNVDILLIGNSDAFDVQLGQNNALQGLLLAGDGKGQFQPIRAKESGFTVACDGKALAVVSTGRESGRLIVAACNQGPLNVFSFETNPPYSPLEVQADDDYFILKDESGNQWIEELYFGSGYLSQNSRKPSIDKHIMHVSVVDSYGKRRTLIREGISLIE